MNIKISVVICTYNRKELLKKTLESVLDQSLDISEYEVLIIDNNSTDGTAEFVAEEYRDKAFIKYFLESDQGISYARNTGWVNSQGEYVAYIDDDEIADHYWIESLFKAMEENTNKKIGAVGGQVKPIWEITPPEWIDEELSVYFSIINHSDEQIIINQNQPITCGNIVYPKRVLEEMGGFDTGLRSRVGHNLISSEDTLMNKKLLKNGYILLYDPSAIVDHIVHKDRLTKKWLVRRFFWAGYSHSYIDDYLLENQKRFINKIRQLMVKSCDLFLNILLAPLATIVNGKNSFLYICRASKNLGYIYKIIF